MGNAMGKRLRVLVVEDDVDTLAAFSHALTMFGVDGIPAMSCAAAREAVRAVGGVDVVVCDVELSDGDGVELARELGAACGCPVAIMSGHPEPEGGLPEGIDLWLQKPVTLPQLRESVEALAGT
jgi:DNA-binding response OmpR family regulator